MCGGSWRRGTSMLAKLEREEKKQLGEETSNCNIQFFFFWGENLLRKEIQQMGSIETQASIK